MNVTVRQFTGCILGLATGDALGAPYEGGFVEQLVWWFIRRTPDGSLRWTDDTQMTLDLAESLLNEGGLNPDALAKRFAASYRWSRGYGPAAAKILKRIRRGEPWQQAAVAIYKDGSFGNGAAMRAPVLALWFPHDREKIMAAARTSASVTHAHPLGIEGAILIAVSAQALLEGQTKMQVLDTVEPIASSEPYAKRLKTIRTWLESEQMPSPSEVARVLGNKITAPASCPTAVYIALRHLNAPFETMMDFIRACRGDVDTIAAMAGALWGIVNGPDRLPSVRLEDHDRLQNVALQLYQRYIGSST